MVSDGLVSCYCSSNLLFLGFKLQKDEESMALGNIWRNLQFICNSITSWQSLAEGR